MVLPPFPAMDNRVARTVTAADLEADWIYAIALTLGDDKAYKSQMLHAAGDRALEEYRQTKGPEYLQLVIDACQAAVQYASDLTTNHDNLLKLLGDVLYIQAQRSGRLEDVNLCCFYRDLQVSLIPDIDPDKPGILNNLANATQLRFRFSSNSEDLDETIRVRKLALELNRDSNMQATFLGNLGGSLNLRFRLMGQIEDLTSAIALGQESIDLLPGGHPAKPALLGNLGVNLVERFEAVHKIDDLRNAIKAKREAVQLTPEGDPNEGLRWLNLGKALLSQADYTGLSNDLADGIEATYHAVKLMPDTDPDKPAAFSNLGNAVGHRFELRGDVSDLDLSVTLNQSAVNLTPAGHNDMHAYIGSLGEALRMRYERLGDIKDLEAAVKAHLESVRLTSDHHIDKLDHLLSLGRVLAIRFQRSRNEGDLNEAINFKRLAVDCTPVGNPQRYRTLNSLASTIMVRFHELGDPSAFNEARDLMEKLVQCPEGYSLKPTYCNNLGTLLQASYTKFGKREELDAALEAHQEALRLTNHDESLSDRVITFHQLATGWEAHWRASGDKASLEHALSFAAKSAQHRTGHPRDRFAGAVEWCFLALKCDLAEQLTAFQYTIQLIPELAWLGLDIKRQHEELGDIPTIIRVAVSAATFVGKHDLALEWLEQGRSVVWGQRLQLRSPVDGLRQHHVELADQLDHLSHQLTVGPNKEDDKQDMGEAFRALVLKREELLREIRSKEGFENFQGPKRITGLHSAARTGRIVTLSVHYDGGDALILVPGLDEVVHVPLPEITYKKAEQLGRDLAIQQFAKRMRGEQSATNDETTARHLKVTPRYQPDGHEVVIRRILAQLWAWVVKPVVDALGLKPDHTDDPPRIWWSPTGPLTFLPIHAAGLYDTDEVGSKIFEYVVSSYTPTISALLESHRPPADTVKIMAVAQPNTPKCSPIPHTVEELKKLEERAKELSIEVQRLEDVQGTVERVVAGMKDCNWAHFSCHGTQHLTDPTKSALLLADGNLELEQIIKHRLPNAEFAFLSACQTATGDFELDDEAVHLVAGMMLAGYRSVIATMWSINDPDGPIVADEVYVEMFKGGKPDYTRAALGLHKGVKKLRESGRSFLAWMSFVHYGA